MIQIELVLSCLDDNTLNKIKRKCESYITYTIDNKQLNNKNDIKTKQKDMLELLELVNTQLVLNQFELSTKNNSDNNNNVKSTLNEPEKADAKESKKKEPKK